MASISRSKALFKLVVPSLLARSTCLSQLPLSHYHYRHSPSYLAKREKRAFTEDLTQIRHEDGGLVVRCAIRHNSRELCSLNVTPTK
jgi:hypothetical protein